MYSAETDKWTVQNIKANQKICTPNYRVNFEAFYGQCVNDTKNPNKKVWMALCKVDGNCVTRVENQANYYIYGNNGTDVQGNSIENGDYILIAKAYNGTIWTKKKEVDFSIVPCTRNLRSEIGE